MYYLLSIYGFLGEPGRNLSLEDLGIVWSQEKKKPPAEPEKKEEPKDPEPPRAAVDG
jgi:hypothetical protein